MSRRHVVVLIVAVLVTTATGCGGSWNGGQAQTPRPVSLPGWRAVDDAPGVSELAPNLSGLHVKDTLGAEAKDKIRNELTERLKKLMPDKIKRMFFQEFVVQ